MVEKVRQLQMRPGCSCLRLRAHRGTACCCWQDDDGESLLRSNTSSLLRSSNTLSLDHIIGSTVLLAG